MRLNADCNAAASPKAANRRPIRRRETRNQAVVHVDSWRAFPSPARGRGQVEDKPRNSPATTAPIRPTMPHPTRSPIARRNHDRTIARRRLPVRRHPLSRPRRCASVDAVPLQLVPPRERRAVRRVGRVSSQRIRIHERRTFAVQVFARSRPHLLRPMRHAADLRARIARGRDRRDHRDARRARPVRARLRNLGRGKARVGNARPEASALPAQQQIQRLRHVSPRRPRHHAMPNGRFGVDTTRSPTVAPRRKSSTAPITAVSARMRLCPRPVVLSMRAPGQNRA